jgi:8-amino-7-oxononanoate synthase
MSKLEQYLAGKLEERIQADNLRKLTTSRAAVDLYSNDYLGLATTGTLLSLMHPMPSGIQATGATGSRLLSGNSKLAEELELTIAASHKAGAALLFNSGYDANMGLLSSIASRHTIYLYDELCHASIIDGIRLSMAKHKYKFAHNDITDLAGQLQKHAASGNIIVVAESVYSMDGDIAPLSEMVNLCEQYDARLVVDEAHATGVIGDHGEGLVCREGLHNRVFARVHTFGKALGCHGAAVVGSSLLREYLVNYARSFIYTTALPAHSLHAIRYAYQYMAGHSFTNRQLHELIAYFRERATGWKDSNTAIQALVVGDNKRTKAIAEKLQRAGLQVNAILHPTVPLGQERLRVCLHTFNTTEQLDLLLSITAQL